MSTHYHAFQSRGFAFTVYEPQVEQWHSHFTGFDPSKVAGTLGLNYDENYLYLTYLQRSYRLRLADGVLEKVSGLLPSQLRLLRESPEAVLPAGAAEEDVTGRWTDELFFNEAMAIYHHLAYTKEYPRALSGQRMASSDLEGGATRNDRRPDPLLVPFARRFSGKCDVLRAVVRALGGELLTRGDVSFRFDPFPQVPVEVIFWDEDDDFPAQVQVLADPCSIDYMHPETIGCIVSDLLEWIQLGADLMTGRTWVFRPHHGMCTAYFQGKGYSEEFTEHMAHMLRRMESEDPQVLLLTRGDVICSHCPFHEGGGRCRSREKTDRYDRGVLETLRIPEGSVMPAKKFRKLVRDRILNTGMREEICGDCRWGELCR